MNKESKFITPLEAFQLFCRELKVENSNFAQAIEGELKETVELRRITRDFSRVLEIVKDWFEVFEDENGYHIRTTFRALFDSKRIDKETFDLFSEVLKWK